MTDRAIPALDDPHTSLTDFTFDLATWCNQWVDDVAFPIMARAYELYDNIAVRRLVGEWARLHRERNQRRLDALMTTAVEDGFVSNTYKLWDRDREGINTALRFLLIENDKEG